MRQNWAATTPLATGAMGRSSPLRQKCWTSHQGHSGLCWCILTALWRGDIPLSQAFWEFAIVYGTIANIVATAAPIAAVAAGLPDAVGIGLFLIPVPYILTAVLGVVRNGGLGAED